MEGIELDIIYNTDATTAKRKAGIEFLLSECDVKPVTFYRIDAISELIDEDDSEYSNIYVGGEVWNCVLKYEDLKEKLAAWKTSNATQS